MNVALFDKQEFREIPGFPQYFVSIDGQILSLNLAAKGYAQYKEPHLIIGYIDKDGYGRVTLRVDRKKKKVFRHTAVLLAWRGPRPEGEEGCHDDGNKSNNHVSNLLWGTQKKNGLDKRRHGKVKGEGNHRHKMVEADVLRLRAEYLHKPLPQLMRENPQYSQFAIWAAVSGYSWSHLPGAIPKNRRCTKNGWREGERVRDQNKHYVQTESVPEERFGQGCAA